MGFKNEFNWVLKLKKEQGLNEEDLDVGREYRFRKEEYRTYPLDIPIDLLNENWEAVAKIIITEVNCFEGKTFGKYKIIKIYSGIDKDMLSRYWQENQELLKKSGAIS